MLLIKILDIMNQILLHFFFFLVDNLKFYYTSECNLTAGLCKNWMTHVCLGMVGDPRRTELV